MVPERPRYTITRELQRRALIGLLALYLVLGLQFALGTPLWQVPDEPAHYNYVRFIAENWRLPELREGDYPHDYLEFAKRYRFEAVDISRIRYESHQPPLYYLLMAPVHAAATRFGIDPVYAIRVASVLLGAIALLLGYHTVRHVFPNDARIALGSMAFAAVLPMHLTMVGGVNNDVLAELMIAAVALQLVGPGAERWTWRRAVLIGTTLGLAALTKLQSYVGFGLVGVAVAWDLFRKRDGQQLPVGRALALGCTMLGIALLVAAPWLLRNARVYGWNDLLALQRHDQVVEGQLTTVAFLRAHGIRALLVSLVQSTFQSFWGQFGWMGVVLHPRYYLAAALLSGIVVAGFGAAMWRMLRRRAILDEHQRRGVTLLAAWGFITLAGYLWWNLSYVQHQGRYLFPALVPLGAAFAVGLRELLTGDLRLSFTALGLVLIYLFVDAARSRHLKLFSTLMVVASGGLLAAAKRIEQRFPGVMMGLVYLAIAIFAVFCLYAYVIPVLAL